MSIEKVSGQGRRTVGKDRFSQGPGDTFSPLAACLWRESSRILRAFATVYLSLVTLGKPAEVTAPRVSPSLVCEICDNDRLYEEPFAKKFFVEVPLGVQPTAMACVTPTIVIMAAAAIAILRIVCSFVRCFKEVRGTPEGNPLLSA